jgi:hypothetical protein
MSYLDTYNKTDLQEIKELITVNPRYTNVVKEKLKALDLIILGEGQHRVVVHNENHNCVIKFQKTEKKPCRGEGNKTEVKTYNTFKEKPVSKILTPVIEHTKNFDIVVQQKTDLSNIGQRDVLKVSASLIYDYGYFTPDISEKNIGMRKDNDGNILSINDYGSGITPIKNTEFADKHEAFEEIIDQYL